MTVGLTALCAFAVVVATTPLAMALAKRLGIVDRPGPLKPQKSPVPYLGGAAVLAGAIIGSAVGRPWFIVPLVLAVVLGVVDDAKGLSPWIRLAGEIAIGVAVAVIVPTHLSPYVGPPLVVLGTVLLVNGMNFLDGLDGLAAGVAATTSVGFAVLLVGSGRYLAVGLACALAGFLVFNRPPARIYLGDSGAYLLGTTLAVLLALAWSHGVRSEVSSASLLLVVIPPAEIAFAVVRRLRSGQSLVLGDRSHPYDRLVRRGWPPLGASLVYVAAAALLTGSAILVSTVRSVLPAVAVVVGLTFGSLCVAGALGAFKSDPDETVSPKWPQGRASTP
jgi:UDP-GlcNAc:undecaprenyl-phosphate GlcNAc-1-phosphate transferase